MAVITGTAANDVLNGTTEADRIEGGAGNDRINGGAGDDDLFGGLGADILTGDAGNDRIFGEDGNDGVYGGGGNDFVDGGNGDDTLIGDGGDDTLIGNTGNDRLSGGIGNDILDGGAGNDIINGEAGNDTIIWRSGDGSDTINGGTGNDTLELHLSTPDLTAQLRSDLAAYKQWAAGQAATAGSAANLSAQTTGTSFTFASLGLTISVLEAVSVSVNGAIVSIDSLINAAPVAETHVSMAATEDVALQGVVSAMDPDGDTMTFAIENGPANGTIDLDAATGAFIYTPAANANGPDAFTVRITDPSGVSTTQTVNVNVAGVADAPNVSASDAVVALAQPMTGTQNDDVLVGNVAPEWATFAVEVEAALSDVDGSETLSITFGGVPAAATLSAGARQADGAWVLSAADLPGLTMTAPTGADFELTVTATASEATGDAASSSATLSVSFDRNGIENDVIDGGQGNDVIDGGTGNDRLIGGHGDDTFIQRAGDGSDIVSGGEGFDTVELILEAHHVTPEFLADIAAYQDWMAAGAEGTFTFSSLALTVDSIEDLAITVAGSKVSIAQLLNVAPVAAASVELTTDEDVAITGAVVASDANGDALTYTVVNGPASGNLSLNSATGEFVYVPGQNKSGTESFSVRITDAFGESVVQTVHVDIKAQADAPTVSASNVVHSIARISTLTGTSGNDTLRGDQYAATSTFALSLAAALTDTDGSETLSVRLAGVPSSASLSAGQRQTDGSWLLQPADLNGLTMTVAGSSSLAFEMTASAQDGNSVAQSSLSMNVSLVANGNMDDRFIASTGKDTYDGGLGIDTVDYASATKGVSVNLSNGNGSGIGTHKFISIENVIGSASNDTITGSSGDNVIRAGAGNDRVNGGAGNDRLIDAAGDDRYDGGAGYDVLDYSASTAAISVTSNRVTGQGNDQYSNIEKVVGSNFADTFNGSRSVNTFDGGAGNDWFRGFQGSDIFTGGAGSDTFVWKESDFVASRKSQGVDTITDFSAGDKLDVRDSTNGILGDVKVTDTTAGSMVSVKVGSVFYDVVLLQNVHGVTTASLLADGQLIA